MKKFLSSVIEHIAHRVISIGVRRAAQILDDMEGSFEEAPTALPEPKLPKVVHH